METHSLILVILSCSFLWAEFARQANLSVSSLFFLFISLSWLVNLSYSSSHVLNTPKHLPITCTHHTQRETEEEREREREGV